MFLNVILLTFQGNENSFFRMKSSDLNTWNLPWSPALVRSMTRGSRATVATALREAGLYSSIYDEPLCTLQSLSQGIQPSPLSIILKMAMSENMGSNQGCSIKLCYSLRNYISFKETTSIKAQASSVSSNAKRRQKYLCRNITQTSSKLSLVTLWQWQNWLPLGWPLLVTEYQTTMTSIWLVNEMSTKSIFHAWCPSVITVIFLKFSGSII